MLWACNQSRPDICFDVNNIASNIKNATIKLLINVNKTINITKTNQYDLKLQPTKKQSKLVVYADATFGNLHDGGSQSANPKSYSKRIKRMARSSLAVEALAMLDGIDSALYIAALLNELIYDKSE